MKRPTIVLLTVALALLNLGAIPAPVDPITPEVLERLALRFEIEARAAESYAARVPGLRVQFDCFAYAYRDAAFATRDELERFRTPE